jgi:YARHG domain
MIRILHTQILKGINLLFIIIFALSAYSNDGRYITSGGVIYPTKETKISLDKEILSFTCADNLCRVDIQFEFNNPEKIARKLLIGFQAPSSVGDVSSELIEKCEIQNFTIVQNGNILPYRLKAAECEDCEIKEVSTFKFASDNPTVYVFLFEITFEPGLNQINHSYRFPASNNVAFDQIYNYILTTGAKWSNGIIKDLTVQINMGENKYFYVNDVFGSQAHWSIIGSGRVTNELFDQGFELNGRMVRVLSGKLQISIRNFRPKQNIEFGIVDNKSFIIIPVDYLKIQSGEVLSLGDLKLSEYHTKEQLKIFRNTIYAQYGYAFNDKKLSDYFSQFEWYMPDPNLKLSDIILTEEEKKYIAEIVKMESE